MRFPHFLLCISLAVIIPHLASATDLPKRKSGLWETTVSMSQGGFSQTLKQCVDEATDTEMMNMGAETSKSMGASCSKSEVTRTATGFENEVECDMDGSKLRSKGSFTGDFSSAFSGTVTTTVTPPLFGAPSTTTTIQAKYVGPCPADMQPGDLILPNGMKTNAKESAAQAESMAQKFSMGKAPQLGDMKGADMAKALAAAQAELDPEDLQAMQEAMKEMGKLGQ